MVYRQPIDGLTVYEDNKSEMFCGNNDRVRVELLLENSCRVNKMFLGN